MNKLRLLLLLTFLAWTGCVKPTPDELYRAQLEERLKKLETKALKLKEKFKSTTDAGAVIQLKQERALLSSEIARLKATLAGTEFK